MSKKITIGITVIALALGGCATTDNMTQTQRETATGAGVGALAGAALGAAVSSGNRGKGAAIGALAGAAGDRWSLGFVAETEQQVVEHLNAHLERLPATDQPSRAVLEQMREDEARHAAAALAAGAARLPFPVRVLMKGASKLMTQTTYWI